MRSFSFLTRFNFIRKFVNKIKSTFFLSLITYQFIFTYSFQVYAQKSVNISTTSGGVQITKTTYGSGPSAPTNTVTNFGGDKGIQTFTNNNPTTGITTTRTVDSQGMSKTTFTNKEGLPSDPEGKPLNQVGGGKDASVSGSSNTAENAKPGDVANAQSTADKAADKASTCPVNPAFAASESQSKTYLASHTSAVAVCDTLNGVGAGTSAPTGSGTTSMLGSIQKTLDTIGIETSALATKCNAEEDTAEENLRILQTNIDSDFGKCVAAANAIVPPGNAPALTACNAAKTCYTAMSEKSSAMLTSEKVAWGLLAASMLGNVAQMMMQSSNSKDAISNNKPVNTNTPNAGGSSTSSGGTSSGGSGTNTYTTLVSPLNTPNPSTNNSNLATNNTSGNTSTSGNTTNCTGNSLTCQCSGTSQYKPLECDPACLKNGTPDMQCISAKYGVSGYGGFGSSSLRTDSKGNVVDLTAMNKNPGDSSGGGGGGGSSGGSGGGLMAGAPAATGTGASGNNGSNATYNSALKSLNGSADGGSGSGQSMDYADSGGSRYAPDANSKDNVVKNGSGSLALSSTLKSNVALKLDQSQIAPKQSQIFDNVRRAFGYSMDRGLVYANPIDNSK